MRDHARWMDEDFGHWLAGFAAGEGSFNIGKNGRGARFCAFRIALAADDADVLREVYEQAGVGRLWIGHPPSQRHKSATAFWTVTQKAECEVLVSVFERFPLRAKKQRDFEIWAAAVRLWNQHEYGQSWTSFDALRRDLHSGRTQRGRKAWVV